MGVDRRDYVVVGVDIVSNPLDYDTHEEFLDTYSMNHKVGKITFLEGYYNGDYFIVGEVLDSADGYNEGLDCSLYGKEQLIEQAKLRVKFFIKEHFKMDSDPHIIVKTQWS